MNNLSTSPSATSIAGALLISNDAATIEQVSQSMQLLAVASEVCEELPCALVQLNRRKFEVVVIDLRLGGEVSTVIERVRFSPSNRTAVIFTVSDSDTETGEAFKAGSNFVLRRPLSLTSIGKTLRVGYGLILRERRRYFRCPVEVPVTIYTAGLPEMPARTANVSESGMAINTSTPLPPGVEVTLHFTLPDCESPFVMGATICWCKESYIGLQFNSNSPEVTGELQEWLARRLEESLPESLAHKFLKLGKS
jgi:CheY-like chemotaxis protein